LDPKRVEFLQRTWMSQDDALRRRDRRIEGALRMLAGQQWTVWNAVQGRYYDVTEWMTEDEKRWRQRPVVNYLLYWFMLTHARMTETPPILSFQPSTGDRADAMLAEVMDTVFKTIWRDAGMGDVLDTLFANLIPGGSVYFQSRVDLSQGELRPLVGPAQLELVDQFGQPTGITRQVPNVPHDRQGNPLAQLTPGGVQVTGEAAMEHEGQLAVDVLSALQVRGEWGPAPWHQKRWHMVRTFLSPEKIWELWHIEVPPDVQVEDTGSGGSLARALLGGGYFGAAEGKTPGGGMEHRAAASLCEVTSYWEQPCDYPGMEETQSSPGGRLLVATRTRCLTDGVRPARFKHTSPIRELQFVRVPGRPSGTSPQEMLDPLQRAINRGYGQFLEHRNLVANPKGLIDDQSGLDKVNITNKPGENYSVTKRSNVKAFEYVDPPSMSPDAWRIQDQLIQAFLQLGNLTGAEGDPPTRDASGELVKELRFNADRFLGATMKRAVEEIARMAEDWIVMLPTIWTEEKLLTYAGEDNIPRTAAVLPHMFETGRVHVLPDVESMLPEGRGERQNKVAWMYDKGFFGMPGSPEATRTFLDLSRFPHLNRASMPGNVHRVTAHQELGQLIRGTPAEQIPIFPWYDPLTHLQVLETYMASPEFLKLDPAMQEQVVLHWQGHQVQMAEMQAQAEAQALAQQARQTAAGQPPPDATAPAPAKAGAEAAA